MPQEYRGFPGSSDGPIRYLLAHSELHLERTGLLGHTKGLFYQISGDRESVGLSNRLLQFACIAPVGGVSQHLIYSAPTFRGYSVIQVSAHLLRRLPILPSFP